MEEVITIEEKDLCLDELDDFDLETPVYQVWALGYDENDCITDFSKLFGTFKDPDTAVKYAENLNPTIPTAIAYVSLEVETVVDEDGEEENVGSIYRRIIINKNYDKFAN